MSTSASTPTAKRRYQMTARAETAAATGERLLAAAWRHFGTRPYEDVRLHEIAADASVTVQTLHNRFHSKEKLFAAAFLWWGAEEVTQRDTASVGNTTAAIKVLFDRYEAHGETILRLLSQEERIPAVRQMTDAGRAYHRRWAQRTFAPLVHGEKRTARRRRVTAIVAATDPLVWKLLRRDMQLSRNQAETVMIEMIEGPHCRHLGRAMWPPSGTTPPRRQL
jgi:AcrR family transcriptional regulator